jgi:hypothetical protein
MMFMHISSQYRPEGYILVLAAGALMILQTSSRRLVGAWKSP